MGITRMHKLVDKDSKDTVTSPNACYPVADVAQLAEPSLRKREVMGSTPIVSSSTYSMPQYNEETIVQAYLKRAKKHTGLVVEVGAADGITGSNSRFLIQQGWSAVLIEPNPTNYDKLQKLYDGNLSVQLHNKACFSEARGKIPFYCDTYDGHGQISTMDQVFRDKWDKVYNAKYVEVMIDCVTLADILQQSRCQDIDFLSVDCEGVDLEVLKGMDWKAHAVGLVCVEFQEDKQCEVDDFMKSVGYSRTSRTVGNIFYERS